MYTKKPPGAAAPHELDKVTFSSSPPPHRCLNYKTPSMYTNFIHDKLIEIDKRFSDIDNREKV